jgi:hypothetical protein
MGIMMGLTALPLKLVLDSTTYQHLGAMPDSFLALPGTPNAMLS